MRRSCLLLVLLAGCATPPPEHFTRLWVEGRTGLPAVGTSTEDGVLMLAEPDWQVGDTFEIQFPIGNSLVVDRGRIDRLNDTVAIVQPLTARLREGRFAGELPVQGEQLWIALRDERDEPLMLQAEPWRDGAWGDWLLLPGLDATAVARDYAGTGIYVRRAERWEIVGVLAGLTAQDEASGDDTLALGFIGLAELARILPDRLDFFARDLRPLRPDFEFGVPLQPGELDLPPPETEPATEKPPAADVPRLLPLPTPGATPPAGAKAGSKPKAPAKPKPKANPKPGEPRAP